MATIVLNWTPAGGLNSTAQLVQRRTSTGSFSTLATVAANVNMYTDTTALDNTIYYYQIVTQCAVGGPVEMTDVEAYKIVCPTTTVNVSGTSATLNIGAVAGDGRITLIRLLLAGSQVQSLPIPGGDQGPYVTIYNSLSYSTTYTYEITLTVGPYTQLCTGNIVIGAAPSCNPVTGLSATIS